MQRGELILCTVIRLIMHQSIVIRTPRPPGYSTLGYKKLCYFRNFPWAPGTDSKGKLWAASNRIPVLYAEFWGGQGQIQERIWRKLFSTTKKTHFLDTVLSEIKKKGFWITTKPIIVTPTLKPLGNGAGIHTSIYVILETFPCPRDSFMRKLPQPL